MKILEIEACRFNEWYDTFKDITVKSVYLPLTDDFKKSLLSDGIVLPKSDDIITTHSAENDILSGDDDDDDDDGNTDWENPDSASAPDFGEFAEQVTEAIKDLGGSVVPKLDWSAPQDATWMSFDNTLRCSNLSEIYLLLKSSDFIVRDLTQPFIHCEDDDGSFGHRYNHHLVLKKWVDIQPGLEFRCFVKNHTLIAIAQRHYCSHYEFLPSMKEEITEDIQLFYYQKIYRKFTLSNYVFDVYRDRKKRWKLLDFNPFGAVTDSPLFDWTELNSWSSDVKIPEFRYIELEGVFSSTPYSSNAVPFDVANMCQLDDAKSLVDFMQSSSVKEHLENSAGSEET